MNNKDILKNGVYIIAEMSANHAGKIENAIEIIKRAKDAGADCVKIQTYTADTLTIKCDKPDFKIHGGLWDGYTFYDLYNDAYTPWEWQGRLKEVCDAEGIDFLSTPFDFTAVDFLESIGIEFYKVASYELVDIPLIEYIAEKKKPMIISCGMGSKEEIGEAVETCKRKGNEEIILLKCCSEYPAVLEDMNLNLIPRMKELYEVPIGLSDHSEGYEAAVIATALGAQVIEKHVCLDKSIKNPDSDFSMEIKDFATMVRKIRETETIMGHGDFYLTEKERMGMTGRRSLYVVEDIKEGDLLTESNIRSIRPSYGLKPKYYKQVLGKRATRDIERGTALKWELFE
ncbi:N-acetylneuraminate synthase [Anaerovibrio sp. JC8]|uniref:pseudaminic acid synthase n=1 Tax=Anaerovibrio sp. JC8 TaxID=1240085 RepID=UPI000A0DC18D|nr:pseudaminic acid synthase [Anaerovibrio sp. JC8]ORU01428.1 N-acetylneuraminate synthase [Anaerovibrio sp. JC8]